MPTQDGNKDLSKPSTTEETLPSSELREDDLEAVTGGLSIGGSTLSSADSENCFSSD